MIFPHTSSIRFTPPYNDHGLQIRVISHHSLEEVTRCYQTIKSEIMGQGSPFNSKSHFYEIRRKTYPPYEIVYKLAEPDSKCYELLYALGCVARGAVFSDEEKKELLRCFMSL